MKKYTKSAKYDKSWIEQNQMGPNPLWLLEDICEHLDLKPGMKVLDMGCGKGLTSVFLAKEYGVTVFANDLWISATENLQRFEEAGVAGNVFPINAEARALPYADGFFDAAISIDSYHYYGTEQTYFPCVFSRLVKPGGQLAIVVPGLVKDFENGYPENMKKYWIGELGVDGLAGELFTFHSKDWWRKLWEKTEIADITACYNIENTKEIWLPWAKWSDENMDFPVSDTDFLADDVNDDLALIAMAAVKKKPHISGVL